MLLGPNAGLDAKPNTEAWIQNPNFKVPEKADAAPLKVPLSGFLFVNFHLKNPFGIPAATVTKETEKTASKGDISLFGNGNNGSPQPVKNPFERFEKVDANAEPNGGYRNPFGAKEEPSQTTTEKPVMKNPFADKPHLMQAGENTATATTTNRNPFQQATESAKSVDEEDNRGSRPRGAHVKIEGIFYSTWKDFTMQ